MDAKNSKRLILLFQTGTLENFKEELSKYDENTVFDFNVISTIYNQNDLINFEYVLKHKHVIFNIDSILLNQMSSVKPFSISVAKLLFKYYNVNEFKHLQSLFNKYKEKMYLNNSELYRILESYIFLLQHGIYETKNIIYVRNYATFRFDSLKKKLTDNSIKLNLYKFGIFFGNYDKKEFISILQYMLENDKAIFDFDLLFPIAIRHEDIFNVLVKNSDKIDLKYLENAFELAINNRNFSKILNAIIAKRKEKNYNDNLSDPFSLDVQYLLKLDKDLPLVECYVGFTDEESKFIYNFLHTENSSMRISVTTILKKNPNVFVKLDKVLNVIGFNPNILPKWYHSKTNRLLPTIIYHDCEQALKNFPIKRIVDSKLYVDDFYRSNLLKIEDFPSPELVKKWEFFIENRIIPIQDNLSRKISYWLANYKCDVLGINNQIFRYPDDPSQESFEFGRGIIRLATFGVYRQTGGWTYSYIPNSVIDVLYLDNWIRYENTDSRLMINNVEVTILSPPQIIYDSNSNSFKLTVRVKGVIKVGVFKKKTEKYTTTGFLSSPNIPILRLSEIENPEQEVYRWVNPQNSEIYGEFTKRESEAIIKWKKGKEFMHQVMLGSDFILDYETNTGKVFKEYNNNIFSADIEFFKTNDSEPPRKRLKCKVCFKIASKMCSGCEETYYCSEECRNMIPCGNCI